MKHYDECYFVEYDSYDDLSLLEVGCQKCVPDYSFGPIIRSNYVLHYIIEGSGVLYLNQKSFPVSSHQAFITPPFASAFYQADSNTPWNYIWLHFNGQKTHDFLHKAGITLDEPVFIPMDDSNGLEQCLYNILHHPKDEYYCIGNLYQAFQILIDSSSRKADEENNDTQLNYIRNTIQYIRKKYAEPVRVSDIADYCGLDRSYLSKLFKSATSYSPQEYLMHVRMSKARKLLTQSALPIQSIAYSVGYPDPFAFSKVFRKETGYSPSEYRKLFTPQPPISSNINLSDNTTRGR